MTTATRDIAFDREIDVRGYNCPIPALRARAALNRMRRGQVLRVVSTDRNAERDFRVFSKRTGNELVAHATSGRDFVFYLRKA